MSELSHDSASKHSDLTEGGTESRTLSGELLISDSRLVKLIEVWPALGDEVKAEILRLAGDGVDDLNDATARELPFDEFGAL